MNSTLKSSNLVPLNITPEKNTQPTQQSLTLIKTAERPDKPNSQQKQAIAQIYVEQAKIYFQARNWRDAIAACQNALKLNPQNTDAYKISGNILKIRGKKAEALGIYAKALEIDPSSAAIYANLGSFYAEQKNWQQALDFYQQAVILDPNLAGAYRSLARVWEELGEDDRALDCLCRAVNLEPEQLSATEYYNFGARLYQQEKLKEASIFYTHGVELNPQAEQLAKLVKILEELEDWQQAVVFYHRLMSLSNGDAHPNAIAAKPIKNLLSKANSPGKTQSQVRQQPALIAPAKPPKLLAESKAKDMAVKFPSAAKPPNSAVSWNNLGTSYAQKKQWHKAISCYQESIALNPKLGKSYRNLARVYSKMGKKEQAALSWYEAFCLSANSFKPEEHFALAQRLLQLKHIDEAIACLRHSLEQNPSYQPASLLLKKLQGN